MWRVWKSTELQISCEPKASKSACCNPSKSSMKKAPKRVTSTNHIHIQLIHNMDKTLKNTARHGPTWPTHQGTVKSSSGAGSAAMATVLFGRVLWQTGQWDRNAIDYAPAKKCPAQRNILLFVAGIGFGWSNVFKCPLFLLWGTWKAICHACECF